MKLYKLACAEYQRVPAACALRRDVYVGATSQEAAAVKGHYLTRGYRGFSDEALLAGSVQEVADSMAQFSELGFTDIIVRNMSSDQAHALGTIERLAEVKEQLS